MEHDQTQDTASQVPLKQDCLQPRDNYESKLDMCSPALSHKGKPEEEEIDLYSVREATKERKKKEVRRGEIDGKASLYDR